MISVHENNKFGINLKIKKMTTDESMSAEAEVSVKSTTELLTKAFSQIYSKIFVRKNISESSKAHSIAEPICLALETMNNFGAANGKDVVYLTSQIKDKFKDSPIEKEITEFCNEVIELAIQSNRFVYTYHFISEHIERVIENDLEC